MPSPQPSEELFAWITDAATAFMQSPVNDLGMPDGPEPGFDLPLLGCAAGDDPIWETYKDAVGPYHWTPAEAFALAYPDDPAQPSELSVVSWVLPQTKLTREEHRKAAKQPVDVRMPSERWSRNRVLAEPRINAGLLRHMQTLLREKGIQAVAPTQLEDWSGMPSERFVFSSTWSERHAAYAAGLGTFGLSDGLITPAGKAMRTGAVVLRAKLPPTLRPYTHHQEYCLFHSSGTCGKCIERCPVGALSPQGHDKKLCKEFLGRSTPYLKEQWSLDGYACGLCQVAVPCESRIPAVSRK